MPAAIFEQDHRDWLGWRNIVPRRKIRLLDIAKYLPKCRWRRGNYEASAHYLGQTGDHLTSFNSKH
jgi:hypothetical protein